MARTVRWWLHRLRAMTIAEVAHRSARLARHPADELRFRTGRYARPSVSMKRYLAAWTGPPPTGTPTPAPTEALLARARDLCAGRHVVLGLGEIACDEPWHLEPRTRGQWPRRTTARSLGAAPAGFDARLTWELNRGHGWVVLASAYAATGDVVYRDRIAHELASWRRANPIGVGINWASAMEAAIRIHAFATIADLVRGDATGLSRELATLIFEHTIFVAAHLSAHSSANNHLLVELTGVIVGARSLELTEELRAHHAAARHQLDDALGVQTHPDGVNAEMATHYHVFVLEALVLTARSERASSTPAVHVERVIAGMTDYLELLRCDDGSLLQQGDSDDGCVLPAWESDPVAQLIATARALVPARSVSTARRSRHFAESGQVVLRSTRLAAAFDGGPFGLGSLAAHAHCDALAVYLALDGRRFLVDRGTYRYNGDHAARDRYRMTAAHSTLQIGTREQAESQGLFLWGRRPRTTIDRCEIAEDHAIVDARHDGFSPWSHHRILVHHGELLLVVDQATGGSTPEPATIRYHLAPELTPERAIGQPGSRFTVAKVGWLWTPSEARIVTTPHSDVYAASTLAPTIEIAAPPALRHDAFALLGAGDFDASAPSLRRLVELAGLAGVDDQVTAALEEQLLC